MQSAWIKPKPCQKQLLTPELRLELLYTAPWLLTRWRIIQPDQRRNQYGLRRHIESNKKGVQESPHETIWSQHWTKADNKFLDEYGNLWSEQFYNATMYTMMNESTTNVRCDPKSNRNNDNISPTNPKLPATCNVSVALILSMYEVHSSEAVLIWASWIRKFHFGGAGIASEQFRISSQAKCQFLYHFDVDLETSRGLSHLMLRNFKTGYVTTADTTTYVFDAGAPIRISGSNEKWAFGSLKCELD